MSQVDYSEKPHLDYNEEHNLHLESCNVNKTEPTQDLDMWTSDPSKFVTEPSPGRSVIGAGQDEAGRPLQ